MRGPTEDRIASRGREEPDGRQKTDQKNLLASPSSSLASGGVPLVLGEEDRQGGAPGSEFLLPSLSERVGKVSIERGDEIGHLLIDRRVQVFYRGGAPSGRLKCLVELSKIAGLDH